jgi:hypothetical protein
MISTYKKDFPWKKWPKFARFWKKILAIARFLLFVPVGSQKYKKILIFSYFHINTCDQIWLNHFQDDTTSATSQNWENKPWLVQVGLFQVPASQVGAWLPFVVPKSHPMSC